MLTGLVSSVCQTSHKIVRCARWHSLATSPPTRLSKGLLNGDFDFAVDTIKIALYTNSATLNEDTTAYTTTDEVVATGYTAGGNTLTPTVSISNEVAFVTFANTTWSGSFTARGALIYKDGGGAICVLDFGSDKTSATTFQVQFPAATSTSALIRIN
jgi:hypothetical protein